MAAKRGCPVNGAAERLIIALDVSSARDAERLVDTLAPHTGWFKIGSVLFTREGPNVCKIVESAGARLFLDLKFHDIPNTVHGAVRSALDTGADMMTVHVGGGPAMLEAAVRARDDSGRSNVAIVGVTVLTHLDIESFRSLYASQRAPEETVTAFARLAHEAGLDGVVASARELPLIKRDLGAGFQVVTPGIRLADAARDDQTRVVTPQDAVRAGADYIVVGRPVITAPDPVLACQKILADMTA